MAVTTTTNVAAYVPERWELKSLKARYAAEVIAQRSLSATENLLNYGDIYHFPVQESLTVGTVSANADFDTTALTPTDATVTVNTHKYVAFEIPFLTQRQSDVDIKEQYADAVGSAIADDTDGNLASTATSLNAATEFVGNANSPTKFGKELAFQALLLLADLNIPKEGLSFFLPPIAFFEGLYMKDEWTAAHMTGMPKSVLTTGFQFPILGVPAYSTTKLATTEDAFRAILAHKEWQALVRQVKLDYYKESSLAGKRAAWTHFWDTIYGYGEIRANHAIQIFIRRTREGAS